jgi:ubiquinone/menaquinone biosynthesis C-methylase UbiE
MQQGKVFPATSARSLVNPLRRVVQSPDRTIRAAQLPPGARVLEIGAGPGFFSPAIARAVPGGHLVVTDLQGEMVEMASRRVRSDRSTPVSFARTDAAQLPFSDGAFDVVFVATMLGEVPDLDHCVAEVRRVLAPNGVAVVAETRRDSDFIPIHDLRALMAGHSFELLGRRGSRWQYVARFRATERALDP